MKKRLTLSLIALAAVFVLLALSVVHYENYKQTQTKVEATQAAASKDQAETDAKVLTASQAEAQKLSTDRSQICADMVALGTVKLPVAAPAECSN